MQPKDFMKIATDGTLIFPNVHDGALVALEYLDDKSICLRVRDCDKRVYSIFLEQVEQFRGDEFMSGSIVLDITIQTGTAVTMEDIIEAFAWRENASPEPYMFGVKDRIADKKSTFFRLNPSYGCRISCVCRSVNIIGAD